MVRRLVYEKTLELNITHEGMNAAGIGVIGFTQQQEAEFGADVLFPLGKPFVLQFKAAKKGADGSWATFYVNNNKLKNQHRALNAIAQSGQCGAYYAFPLIVSDVFLTSQFGNLLSQTCMVDPSHLTGNLNWVNQIHSVTVRKNCTYTVKSSEEVKGEGVSAKQYFAELSKVKDVESNERVNLSDFIRNLIENLDRAVQKAEIFGQSEHTLVVTAINTERRKVGFLQLPVRIKGLREKTNAERIEY